MCVDIQGNTDLSLIHIQMCIRDRDKAESDVNEPVEVFVNVTNDSRYTVNEIVQLYICLLYTSRFPLGNALLKDSKYYG